MAAAPLMIMDSTAISPGRLGEPRKREVGGRDMETTVYPSRTTPTMVPAGFWTMRGVEPSHRVREPASWYSRDWAGSREEKMGLSPLETWRLKPISWSWRSSWGQSWREHGLPLEQLLGLGGLLAHRGEELVLVIGGDEVGGDAVHRQHGHQGHQHRYGVVDEETALDPHFITSDRRKDPSIQWYDSGKM